MNGRNIDSLLDRTKTFGDPLFETKDYQAFLRLLGYEPVAKAAYEELL